MQKMIYCFLSLIPFFSLAQGKLYPVEMKNKWGYMNTEGKMMLPFEYDYADEFQEGLAVVAVKNMPCIINTSGTRIIDTGLFQFISPFNEGLAAAREFDGAQFYINTQGTKIISLPPYIYEARKFNNGVAVVSKKLDKHELKFGRDIATLDYRFGLMDKSGAMITDFIFEDADDMLGEVTRVRQRFTFGLVNARGEWVAKPIYANIGSFNEGKAVVDFNGKYGYINTQGKMVIKPTFPYAYSFSEGLAGVYIKNKYGFIDSSGTIKIPATYEQIKPFSEGLAAVMKDGKWGFINTSGEWVLRNVFDNVSVFSEGKCAVLVKKYWGFIDKQGNMAIPAEYDAVGSFYEGIADVVYRDINLYINQRGVLLPILKKE